MPTPIDSEKAALRDALEGEHRVLKRIQKVMIDALPPDAGKSDDDIVDEIWEGGDIDPAPEINEGEKVLARTRAEAPKTPDPANDGHGEAVVTSARR
jgi:hypothetical protein